MKRDPRFRVPARGTPRVLIVIGFVASLVAGCASTTPETEPTPTPVGGMATPTSTPSAARPDYTEADVRFMQGMIAHHAQALVMTELVPERAAHPSLRLLAERIEVSQQDEIAQMQRWLRNRGEMVPDPGAPHAHHGGEPGALMPGMLTDEELARLEHARGSEFDRLFLESMIRHHEGALVMVRQLFGTPGAGQGSELYSLASDIDADQRAEIERMRALLRTVLGGR